MECLQGSNPALLGDPLALRLIQLQALDTDSLKEATILGKACARFGR
jgi:hypothetical protein